MLYALKFFSVLALFIAFHSFSLPLVFGASAEGEDANKQVKPSYLTLSQDLNALKKHVYQRPCNQMFFAGSHNAWFSRERGFRKILWIIPMYDQEVGLKEQMECGARLFKTSLFWTKPKTPCCPKLKVYDGSYEDGQQIVMAHGNPPYGAIVPTWFMKKGEPELFSDGLNKLKELAVKELDNFENKLHRWMQKPPPTVEFLEDGKAFDKGLNVIVPAPIPPVFFLQLYSLLGKTGKELKRDLKKSGITDYVWYL